MPIKSTRLQHRKILTQRPADGRLIARMRSALLLERTAERKREDLRAIGGLIHRVMAATGILPEFLGIHHLCDDAPVVVTSKALPSQRAESGDFDGFLFKVTPPFRSGGGLWLLPSSNGHCLGLEDDQ